MAIARELEAADPLHRHRRGGRGLRRVRCRGLRRRAGRGAGGRARRGDAGGQRMIVFDRVSKRYANGREALTQRQLQRPQRRDGVPDRPLRRGQEHGAEADRAARATDARRRAGATAKNPSTLKSRHIAAFRRGIGVVFQDHKLLADRPVYDNVALPLAVAATPLKEIDKRVRAALDQVGLLGKERALPLELSVGEQQRVGIARAVVSKPPLLIADEPTGNLDPDLSLEVMRLFRRFQDVGVTVVVATHDLHLVREFGQRVIVLEHGASAGRCRAIRCRAWWPPDERRPSPAAGTLQALLGSLGRLARSPFATLLTLLVIALALALPAALRAVRDQRPGGDRQFRQRGRRLGVSQDRRAARQGAAAGAGARSGAPDVAAVTLISADKGLEDFAPTPASAMRSRPCKENPLPHVLHVRPRAAASSAPALESLRRYFARLARSGPGAGRLGMGDALQRHPRGAAAAADHRGRARSGSACSRSSATPSAWRSRPARRDRGDEARRRLERFRAPAVPVHRRAVRARRRAARVGHRRHGRCGARRAGGDARAALRQPLRCSRASRARTSASCSAPGSLLGWLGAWISAARHLRSIEPRA